MDRRLDRIHQMPDEAKNVRRANDECEERSYGSSACSAIPTYPRRRGLDTGRCRMKAIVVTDQAAGMAGMTLVERPEPEAAINDVVVQVHASGFVPTELAWP